MTTKAISPGTHVRNFIGDFSKKALEGASLTGLIMLVPHILKKMVSEQVPTLSSFNEAVAWTATGALAWPVYKTTFEPISEATYNAVSNIPKKVSAYVTSFFPKKDAPLAKTSSLYGTTLWGLGMLSFFAFTYTQASKLLTQNGIKSPLYPLLSAIGITYGGSYAIKGVINYAASATAEFVKDTKIVSETATIVDQIWNFGSSLVKSAGIGAGILGAYQLKEEYISPAIDSEAAKITWTALESTATLVSGPLVSFNTNIGTPFIRSAGTVLSATATEIAHLYTAITNNAQTLATCQDQSLPISSLCSRAHQVKVLGDIADQSSKATLWVGEGLLNLGFAVGTGFDTAWKATGSAINQTVITLNSAATSTINSDAGKFVSWAGGQAIQVASDPTVQTGALAVAATGLGLYGLHFVATKASEYYKASQSPLLPFSRSDVHPDINPDDARPLPLPSAPPLAPPTSPDNRTEKYLEPSAPPADGTSHAVPMPEQQLPTATAVATPINVIAEPFLERPVPEQALTTVTFWSHVESFMGQVTTFVTTAYSSFLIWFSSLWTKRTNA